MINVKRRFLILVLTFAFVFTYFGGAPVLVNAGNSGVQVENGSIFEGEELSVSDWDFSKTAGIKLEKLNPSDEKSAVAIKTQNIGKLLTSRTKILVTEGIDKALDISMDLSIVKLLDNNKFGFVFGTPKLRGEINADGTTFLYFEKNGDDFNYGLKVYADGAEVNLLPATLLLKNDAENISVNVLVSSSGKITLAINGNSVYSSTKDGEVNASGYLGFAQDGVKDLASSEVTEIYLKDINIVNEYYDRPETPLTMRADFSNSEFNTEEWHLQSKTAAPNGGVFVADDMLKFSGSGQGAFYGTNYKYSNFVLEYDVFGAKNHATIEGDGWVNAASSWQGVCFGIPGDITATLNRDETRDCLMYFSAGINATTGERTSNKTTFGFIERGVYRTTSVVLPEKYSFFKPGFEDSVRVRLSVIDGVMKVSVKLVDEYDFTEIYSYEFKNGYNPSGFVSLHGEGNQYVINRTMYSASYFNLDNIEITNYDYKPNVITVGFTTNVLKPIGDYEYVNTWSDSYLLQFTKGKGTK